MRHAWAVRTIHTLEISLSLAAKSIVIVLLFKVVFISTGSMCTKWRWCKSDSVQLPDISLDMYEIGMMLASERGDLTSAIRRELAFLDS